MSISESAIKKCKMLMENQRYILAEAILKQLLKVDDKNFDILELQGCFYQKVKNNTEAIKFFKKALKIKLSDQVLNKMCLSYMYLEKYQKAESCILQAIKINPINFIFYNNYALLYKAQNKIGKAIKKQKKAIKINPKAHSLYVNLGSLYGLKKNIKKSVECYNKALELNPNAQEAKINLAYAYLLNGEYKKGWELYENRLNFYPESLKFQQQIEKHVSKKWEKENGKVLFYCNQGHGDLIQFSRFIKYLNLDYQLLCPDSLVKIFEYNNFNVISNLENCDCDYYCEIMSLPYMFNLPIIGHSYLDCDSRKIKTEKIKIGISWCGSPYHPNDKNRSCNLSYFKKIEKKEIQLFSLQKHIEKRYYPSSGKIVDLSKDSKNMNIINCGKLIDNYYDTASWIKSMDLIVSVDTSIIHLAGAMGKKTLLLLPYNNDWRWGINNTTTQWYDSVEILRQKKHGDWIGLFKDLEEHLLSNLNQIS